MRELADVLGFKMFNDPVNNLQIKLLEGPDRLINFAFSEKFDERLSLFLFCWTKGPRNKFKRQRAKPSPLSPYISILCSIFVYYFS
jgi:hypothetical protein